MDLYQVCVDDAPGVKIGPTTGGHKMEHRNKESHISKFFSSELEGIELWYLVFSISLWTSAKFIYMMLVGSKLAPPWGSQVGHKLEHRNKENQLQNSSSLKLKGLELWYLVFSISLWTFINLIHMIPMESKLAPPWGSQVGTKGTKMSKMAESSAMM